MTKRLSDIKTLLACLLCFGAAMALAPALDKKSLSRYLRPPVLLKNFTLGYGDLIADTLWIRLLQDFTYCENSVSAPNFNPGVGVDAILSAKLGPSRCNQGWVYSMVDSVTDLAPRFRHAYYTGAVNLSVAVDDREGARLIFEKGIKKFPDFWQLVYAASYHYLYELQQPARAADLLLQASRYGGPSWFPVLAGRLYTAAGQTDLGLSVLEEFLKTNPPEEAAERTRKRIEDIKAGRSVSH